MKNVILFLAVLYAANLVQVYSLAAETGGRRGTRQTDQVVAKAPRVDRDSQRGNQSVREENDEVCEIPGVTKRERPEATGATEAKAASLYDLLAPELECGCVSETIHANGDCKRNYAVFFMADWCMPCKKMYAAINSLREQGYIIYVFNVDQASEAVKKARVTTVPTFIVFENGQEIARYIGRTSEDKLKQHLKTRRSQEQNVAPEPADKPADRSVPTYQIW